MEGIAASLALQAEAVSRVVTRTRGLEELADELQEQGEAWAAEDAAWAAGETARSAAEEAARSAAEEAALNAAQDVAAEEAVAALEEVEETDHVALACYASAESKVRALAKSSHSYKRVEGMTAGKYKVKWRHRGPGIVDTTSAPVAEFRGQAYRAGSHRYANSGGKWRDHYKTRPHLWQDNKAKAKGKGKGKGKGKEKAKAKAHEEQWQEEQWQGEPWQEEQWQEEQWQDVAMEEQWQEEQWQGEGESWQEWGASSSHGGSSSSSSAPLSSSSSSSAPLPSSRVSGSSSSSSMPLSLTSNPKQILGLLLLVLFLFCSMCIICYVVQGCILGIGKRGIGKMGESKISG